MQNCTSGWVFYQCHLFTVFIPTHVGKWCGYLKVTWAIFNSTRLEEKKLSCLSKYSLEQEAKKEKQEQHCYLVQIKACQSHREWHYWERERETTRIHLQEEKNSNHMCKLLLRWEDWRKFHHSDKFIVSCGIYLDGQKFYIYHRLRYFSVSYLYFLFCFVFIVTLHATDKCLSNALDK